MRYLVLAALCLSAVPGAALAAADAQQAGSRGHTIVMPDQLSWQPAPPGLPEGAQIAVLDGDPTASSGTFTMRVKMPAGYSVAPHAHPTDEDLTILSGTLRYGGAPQSGSGTIDLGPGSFVFLPGQMPHHVSAPQGVEFQLHGNSPFGITYVNPADDPRQEQAKTK